MHEGDPWFESALDDCCDRARKGESLSAILASQPVEYQAELGRLVPLAARVGVLGVDPSPAFRAKLADRLASSPAPRSVPWGFSLPAAARRLLTRPLAVAIAAVVALSVALGCADAAAASDSTLPDSPLYQVKAAHEWVEVSLTREPAARTAVHLKQIAQREAELERALRTNRSPAVIRVVTARLSAATESMVTDALAAKQQGAVAPSRRAVVAIGALEQRLERLSVRARPAVRRILSDLRQDLSAQRARLGPAE